MADILEFKKREAPQPVSRTEHMITLNIYSDIASGELEVSAEVAEQFTDYEVFEAMIAAAYKYAADTGIYLDEGLDDEIVIQEEE